VLAVPMRYKKLNFNSSLHDAAARVKFLACDAECVDH
jgi:hypothetical protein